MPNIIEDFVPSNKYLPTFSRHFPGSRDSMVNIFDIDTEVMVGKPQTSVPDNRIRDNGSICSGLEVRNTLGI